MLTSLGALAVASCVAMLVATERVARATGDRYDRRTEAAITAGGLNGITSVLLARPESATKS